jgi:hypothetical protein
MFQSRFQFAEFKIESRILRFLRQNARTAEQRIFTHFAEKKFYRKFGNRDNRRAINYFAECFGEFFVCHRIRRLMRRSHFRYQARGESNESNH